MDRSEQIKQAQQTWYLKNREREREKRRIYYDVNVKGTPRKNNPEAAKRARDKFRATHNTERFCKFCKKTKPVEQFEPRRHYCIKCAPKKGTDSDKRYRKNLKIKEVKAIKLAEKLAKVKEKPVRILKTEVKRKRELCEIKITDTRVYPKYRDVRSGWDKTMANLKKKFETA